MFHASTQFEAYFELILIDNSIAEAGGVEVHQSKKIVGSQVHRQVIVSSLNGYHDKIR